MAFRPRDTLLSRLLLSQVALLGAAVLIFGALVVVERNQWMVQLYSAPWARQILAAAQPSITAIPLPMETIPEVRRFDALPPGFKLSVTHMPAVADFIERMAHYGVQINEVRMSYAEGKLTLWCHVQFRGAPPVWLSGNSLPTLPHWSNDVFYSFGVLFLLIAAVSWRFTRRVTHPLAELSRRMQAHARTGVEPRDVGARLRSAPAPLELVEIEAAYRQLAERLQRNERERALLLAGVSHDLRSPLTRIRLAAEMLPESDATAAGIASITRNVDLADQLTASFLEFIRTGTVELNQTVDLAAIARKATARFERPSHELQVQAPDALLLSQAHGLLVERLIVNLVDNALKHGRVPVKVAVSLQGEMAALDVFDAGPGLLPEGGGRLMEAFARGDASRSVPGFGLGLAISQQIVVRLQGELAFCHEGGIHQVQIRLPLTR